MKWKHQEMWWYHLISVNDGSNGKDGECLIDKPGIQAGSWWYFLIYIIIFKIEIISKKHVRVSIFFQGFSLYSSKKHVSRRLGNSYLAVNTACVCMWVYDDCWCTVCVCIFGHVVTPPWCVFHQQVTDLPQSWPGWSTAGIKAWDKWVDEMILTPLSLGVWFPPQSCVSDVFMFSPCFVSCPLPDPNTCIVSWLTSLNSLQCV